MESSSSRDELPFDGDAEFELGRPSTSMNESETIHGAHDGSAPPRLLSGLVAAVFTPMYADGTLALGTVPRALGFTLDQGADGIFVCGSTGECPSLTIDERMRVAEAYVSARDESEAHCSVPVVVQVGHDSLREAGRLAAHAASIGADAIGVVPPSYFPAPPLEGLTASLAELAAAAPTTPMYYYHIPRLTRVGTRMIDLLERAEAELPSLVGIKFSSFELDDLLRCVHFADRRYDILFGSDEMLLAGLSMGASGAVGSTYNFLGPHYRRVIEAFEAGDIARAQEHQLRVTRMVHAILAAGGASAIKAAMGLLGVDCGPPRLPQVAVAPERAEELRRELRALDGSVGGTGSTC